jgi:hypothetical protein
MAKPLFIEQRISFRDGQWNTGSFAAFRMRQKKWGPQKWTDATRNFWTSKCEGLYRHKIMAQLL